MWAAPHLERRAQDSDNADDPGLASSCLLKVNQNALQLARAQPLIAIGSSRGGLELRLPFAEWPCPALCNPGAVVVKR